MSSCSPRSERLHPAGSRGPLPSPSRRPRPGLLRTTILRTGSESLTSPPRSVIFLRRRSAIPWTPQEGNQIPSSAMMFHIRARFNMDISGGLVPMEPQEIPELGHSRWPGQGGRRPESRTAAGPRPPGSPSRPSARRVPRPFDPGRGPKSGCQRSMSLATVMDFWSSRKNSPRPLFSLGKIAARPDSMSGRDWDSMTSRNGVRDSKPFRRKLTDSATPASSRKSRTRPGKLNREAPWETSARRA